MILSNLHAKSRFWKFLLSFYRFDISIDTNWNRIQLDTIPICIRKICKRLHAQCAKRDQKCHIRCNPFSSKNENYENWRAFRHMACTGQMAGMLLIDILIVRNFNKEFIAGQKYFFKKFHRNVYRRIIRELAEVRYAILKII
jgi:hypothetical protein